MLLVSETTEQLRVENKNLGQQIVGKILIYCDDNKTFFCLIKKSLHTFDLWIFWLYCACMTA